MSTPPPNAAGTFRAHPAFASLLTRHGLADAESLYATENGTPLRRLRTRENWRLDLSDGSGGTTTLYLKKHRVRTLATRLRAWFRLPAPRTPARAEADRTEQLAALGIPTMTVAAYGERLRPDGTLVAGFLTEELTGFEQLDLFLPRRFTRRDDPTLRALIAQVAELAARFHNLGFNHRDLYTCHFFVKGQAAGSRDQDRAATAIPHSPFPIPCLPLHIIDLQRVQRWPAPLRRRWIVKDLAQLAYSCPPRLIGPAERMRFFRQYLGLPRLDTKAKRLARAVLTREAALTRKHGPYRDWNAELHAFAAKAA